MFDGLKDVDRSNTPKTKLLKTSMRHQLNEFFDHSTLHGVRYIAQSDRPLHERFMWFSFLSVGIVITSIIIISLWEKFQTSPTITGLDTDFHNWEVEFPAITICPKKPTSDEKVWEYIKSISDNTETERMEIFFKYVTEIASCSYQNMNKFENFTKYDWLPKYAFKDIAYKVVYHCEDLLFDCTFKGEPYNCCTEFVPVFTEYGFCYSFNSEYALEDWPWKPINYTKSERKLVYETDNKLTMTFNMENVTYNHLKIFIHNRDNMIILDSLPQHTWNRRIAKIVFNSKHTYTTEGARQLTIKQRKCVFPDEIPLITNTFYTFSACMIQCRMDASKKLCGCIPWFYNNINGIYKYCNLDGLTCISKHLVQISSGLSCSCELGCMNTVYEVEKLQDAQAELIEEPLEISFVSWPMVRYRREVLFGWVDLLVAFGGIAGLFLGFSLLSGVEILYYFTLRACCMITNNPEVLEELSQEYEQRDTPVIDLGLKPLWTTEENTINPIKPNNNNDKKIEPLSVLPYLP